MPLRMGLGKRLRQHEIDDDPKNIIKLDKPHFSNQKVWDLITDKNFRVSIRIGQDRALGLFIPTHGKYGLLEGVRKSMPLTEGEIAYTSGISEIYPPNIPVARVVSIKRDENNPFQHIVFVIL